MMNNWYKISKMIDLTRNEDTPTYAFCDKCKRWATMEGKHIVWKEYFNMSPVEQQEYDLANKNFQMGSSKVISKICPDCQNGIDPNSPYNLS